MASVLTPVAMVGGTSFRINLENELKYGSADEVTIPLVVQRGVSTRFVSDEVGAFNSSQGEYVAQLGVRLPSDAMGTTARLTKEYYLVVRRK